MKNSSRILYKAVVSSLIGALLVSGTAQAGPRPYSKTLTFTQSTTAPAPPPASRPYFPSATKYSTVKLNRARTQVAMESLEIAHEGFRTAKRKGARAEGITIPSERIQRVRN